MASRLDAQQLLGQPHRAAILALVRGEPGVSLSRAARALGLSYQLVSFHARHLDRGGFLKVVREGRRTWLFVPGAGPEGHLAAYAAARQGPQRVVLDHVAAQPGIRLSRLAARMGRRRSTMHATLQRLARSGLVLAGRQGVTLTPAGEAVLRTLRGETPPAPPQPPMPGPGLPLAA